MYYIYKNGIIWSLYHDFVWISFELPKVLRPSLIQWSISLWARACCKTFRVISWGKITSFFFSFLCFNDCCLQFKVTGRVWIVCFDWTPVQDVVKLLFHFFPTQCLCRLISACPACMCTAHTEIVAHVRDPVSTFWLEEMYSQWYEKHAAST